MVWRFQLFLAEAVAGREKKSNCQALKLTWIATLDHEILNNPMEYGVIIVASAS